MVKWEVIFFHNCVTFFLQFSIKKLAFHRVEKTKRDEQKECETKRLREISRKRQARERERSEQKAKNKEAEWDKTENRKAKWDEIENEKVNRNETERKTRPRV